MFGFINFVLFFLLYAIRGSIDILTASWQSSVSCADLGIGNSFGFAAQVSTPGYALIGKTCYYYIRSTVARFFAVMPAGAQTAVVYIMTLLLQRELQKRLKSMAWLCFTCLMFLASMRSFIPGLALAFFLIRKNTFTALLGLMFSFFSSAITTLYCSIVIFVFLKKKKLLPIIASIITIGILFCQKGFHYGENTENIYSIKNIMSSLNLSFGNSSFFYFWDVIKEKVKPPKGSRIHYKEVVFVKFLVLLFIFFGHLVSCVILFKRGFYAIFLIFVVMLPFAFLEGYGYTACVGSLFILFVSLVKNRLDVLDTWKEN